MIASVSGVAHTAPCPPRAWSPWPWVISAWPWAATDRPRRPPALRKCLREKARSRNPGGPLRHYTWVIGGPVPPEAWRRVMDMGGAEPVHDGSHRRRHPPARSCSGPCCAPAAKARKPAIRGPKQPPASFMRPRTKRPSRRRTLSAQPSASRRAMVRGPRLAAAAAPARHARRGAGGRSCAAGRGDRRGQDAGRLPADARRPDRTARPRASTRSMSRR